jgi:uncharacterized protein YjlB
VIPETHHFDDDGARVALPETDPVAGATGSLVELWGVA